MSERLPGPELDRHPERPQRQVGVQPAGDDRRQVPAVGLQQLDRPVAVLEERAPAHGAVGVGEGRRTLRGVRHVDVPHRRTGGRPVVEDREGGADRGGQAAGEEGGDARREQQVDRRPVAAADRAVALEVGDRVVGEQVALVAVERHEERAQGVVQGEAVAHPEHLVHEPAEAERPGALGDLLVHRGVAVDRQHVHVGVDAVPAERRPGALGEPVQQGDQVVVPVEAHRLVTHEVAERGDALHVVADVGRAPGHARVAVVHDGEDRAVAAR